MSSVLYQSFNSNGSPALRNDINTIRNQLNDVKKDMALLIKALELKSPETVEEFSKMKAQEAVIEATQNLPPPQQTNTRNAVNTIRR